MRKASVSLIVLSVLVLISLLVSGCGASPTPKVVEKEVVVTVEVEKKVVVEVEVERVVTVEVEVEKEVVVTATPPAPAEELDLARLTVPLGWMNNDEFAALQAAEDMGYFSQHGLDVTLISGGGSTGFDPIRAIQGFDPSIRFGVPAALSQVIVARSQGIPAVVIGALMQYEPSGFLTLIGEDADGNMRRSQTPCDFKDRVVAMQPDSTWYVDALGGLCETGALKSGVDFTVVPAGWSPDCLTVEGAGGCDFYCAWTTNQPFVFASQGMVEGEDYEMFLSAEFLPFYYVDVVITTEDYIAEHPDVVEAFVRASMEGLQFVLDNPDEAVEITSKREGVTVEHAEWRIPVQNRLAVSPETEEFGLGYVDPVKVQAMVDFLYENGQIETNFDAVDMIDNSFLLGPG